MTRGLVHLAARFLSLLVVAAGCSAAPDVQQTATTAPAEDSNGVLPPADPERPLGRDAANGILSEVGLRVDREVVLPGGDETALVVVVSGDTAVEQWHATRELVDRLGRYPIMSVQFDYILGTAGPDPADPSAVIAEAATIAPAAWFAERAALFELSQADLEAPGPLPTIDWDKDSFGFTRHVLTGETLENVDMVLLPTTSSWEAVAFLNWGGWNDAPLDVEVVALQRYWFEQHQAEVISIEGSSIEMFVGSPPRTEEAAKDLAREHFLFAPDNVWQGVGDIETLASAIQDASAWFFWWD